MLTFHIEFEFRSKLLQALMAALFEETPGRMVTAFKAVRSSFTARAPVVRAGVARSGGRMNYEAFPPNPRLPPQAP
jgi:hypothetical protein